MLDIFKNDAFSVTSLTDFVNDLKYRPGRIGEMGLFSTTPVATTSIAIERVGDILQLVKPTPRGGPGETRDMPKRKMSNLTVPHFQRDWSVMADEVQGVRAKGSETELETVQSIVGEKINAQTSDMDLTEEHARLGAVSGIITYADGSTLNLFTEFGVTEETEVDFDLDAATPADGALRLASTKIIRAMKKRLGAVPFASVHSFVGDTFFDQLLQHKEVRDTYKGWNEAQILRDSYVGPNRASNPIFEFGGIVWENYGEIDGEGVGIATTKARFFPVGVANLFKSYTAPADYIETVNTLGERLYAKQWPMPNDKGINGELQMNELNICTRPGALMGGRNT
ncbi:major capsid protein [Rhizobium johnstonii]|uniref:major capsid protein n=1 Tax=Rhizobium johnstonii TaxID=3019933 RepID=UPI003F946768